MFVLNIAINIVVSHITAVSHHITVFFFLLSILPLFSVCLLLYSYICVQDAMALMRLKIQTRKLIKTSTVYLYVKKAKYSYAGLYCFYCSHMHDRVYCNRANSKLKQKSIIRLACRLLLLNEDNRTCCMHRMMTLFI